MKERDKLINLSLFYGYHYCYYYGYHYRYYLMIAVLPTSPEVFASNRLHFSISFAISSPLQSIKGDKAWIWI